MTMRSHRPSRNTAVRIRGLTRKQHAFIREKVLGMNDKEAALAAGYSLSVAENTKQKIWNARVHLEFKRLNESLRAMVTPMGTADLPMTDPPGKK
jgi:phage terminase small subunit